MVTVGKGQSGQNLTVREGDTIQIELPGTGGTGYGWHLDNLDSRFLKPIAEETERLSRDGKIGAPVMRLWRFKRQMTGRTEINMAYYRPWEGVGQAADHFSISIHIVKRRIET